MRPDLDVGPRPTPLRTKGRQFLLPSPSERDSHFGSRLVYSRLSKARAMAKLTEAGRLGHLSSSATVETWAEVASGTVSCEIESTREGRRSCSVQWRGKDLDARRRTQMPLHAGETDGGAAVNRVVGQVAFLVRVRHDGRSLQQPSWATSESGANPRVARVTGRDGGSEGRRWGDLGRRRTAQRRSGVLMR